MSMSRRDFIAIAEGFKTARPDPEIAHPDVVTAWEMAVTQVADRIDRLHGGFDLDRFYKACSLDIETA